MTTAPAPGAAASPGTPSYGQADTTSLAAAPLGDEIMSLTARAGGDAW